jgi:hypothetical protein
LPSFTVKRSNHARIPPTFRLHHREDRRLAVVSSQYPALASIHNYKSLVEDLFAALLALIVSSSCLLGALKRGVQE